MERLKLRRDDPWFPAFILSSAALAASVFALVAAILDSPRSTSGAGSTADPNPHAALVYDGPLPAGLESFNLVPRSQGHFPDVTFVRGDLTGTPVRSFVPIAAMGTGVDSLHADKAQELLSGKVTRWQDVGGRPGAVTVAAVDNTNDAEAIAEWVALSPNLHFPSYEALRAAMTLESGIIALVPVAEVRVGQLAIALDGADPVRGRGDLEAWPFMEWLALHPNSPAGQAAAPAIREAMAQVRPKPVTVIATGDILQSRCSLTRIRATGDWAAALRGPVGEYLASADLTLASLDGSIQDINPPFGCVVTTNLSSPPEVVAALTLAGIDGVTVATNHIFDCGVEPCGNRAFLRTLELLDKAGIKSVGGGANLEAALRPATFTVGEVRIGVLGFDDVAADALEATATEPGTAPLDDDYTDDRALESPAFYHSAEMLGLTRFTERIRKLKSEVDVVIVQVQSGTEDTHTPSERSIKALRAAADAGADLVVGNQAHWVQAVEYRDNAFIAYALGNFIFDQKATPEQSQGYLLEATFHGNRLVAVRLVPYQIADQYRPEFVAGETRNEILGDVFKASAALPAAR